MRNPWGFTLIELMVAITIIAIMATIGLASYNQAQISGRDGKRKQDLKSIALALDLYKVTTGHYPDPPGDHAWSSQGSFWLTDQSGPGLTKHYINVLPQAPTTTEIPDPAVGPNAGYLYEYFSPTVCGTGKEAFELVASLENGNDIDINHTQINSCTTNQCTANPNGYCILRVQ